jgi:hypothetical protein
VLQFWILGNIRMAASQVAALIAVAATVVFVV